MEHQREERFPFKSLFFLLFARRDVGLEAEETERSAIRRPRTDLASIMNPFVGPVFAPHAVFSGKYRDLTATVPLKISYYPRAIVRMDEG
jgi:hypothetical protein